MITFVTGNQGKADFLAKYLGTELAHQKLELDEVQSLDIQTITKHKLLQAYDLIKKPVIVEDVGLTFQALSGQLPGPFIKWFLEVLGNDGICKLLDGYTDRSAIATVCFGFFDGQTIEFFQGSKSGTIADSPRGSSGYGWDEIFIPEGTQKTYAEMDEAELASNSLRTTTVYPELKHFIDKLQA